jgi:SWI/SNF-related matrix-associated actin-dependent regulator of chromatin subfamily A3
MLRSHSIRHVVPGTLNYYIYHGPDRRLSSSSPLPHHIVFSTYGTVAADFSRGGGVLNCFHWYRLILDEGRNVPVDEENSLGQS